MAGKTCGSSRVGQVDQREKQQRLVRCKPCRTRTFRKTDVRMEPPEFLQPVFLRLVHGRLAEEVALMPFEKLPSGALLLRPGQHL